MRFFLLLLLFLSSQAFAQKRLGREAFQVSIRPVLNGILGDFYQMVSLFPYFPKEIVPLIKEVDTLASEKEILRETCPRLIDKKCADTIKALQSKLQSARALSVVLMSHHQIAPSPYLNTMTGIRIVSQFDTLLEDVKGQLDNTSYLLAARIPEKKETYQVLKQLDELNTLLALALVEFVPHPYREDFRHFYFNFAQPVQTQISKAQNYEFFNRNINSLNFALNLLNLNLTKRNKKTPDGMAPYLAVMHNRWNSILRHYF